MKRIPSLLLALSFILLILTACSSRSTAVAAVPTITSVHLPASPTPAPATVTPPPTSSLTETPAPALTATLTLPTPTPTIAYAQECITIEDELPADLRPGGALLLYGGTYGSYWNKSMVHLDLMSKRRSPLPYSAQQIAVSPDGKWLAYLDAGWNARGQKQNLHLRVTNAEGRHLDLSYWGLNWQDLLGWVANEQLLLHSQGFPGGDYILLNPFTSERSAFDLPVPDFSVPDMRYYGAPAFPNIQRSHWLLRSDEDLADSVWQFVKQGSWEVLWRSKATRYVDGAPAWSPDGKYFKILEFLPGPSKNLVNYGVILVDQNGSATPLTRPIGEEELLSWSPDSRFLAGWLQLDPKANGYPFPNDLVLIEVGKPQVTDLCIRNQAPSDIGWIDNAPPIWSPDGRFLAVAFSRVEERAYYSIYTREVLVWDTAIIDLLERKGYRLAQDARPEAWMKKP